MQEQEQNINNYIPINRKLFKHGFWLEHRIFSKAEAWIDLLQSARFELAEGKVLIGSSMIKFNRGEMVASIRFLVDRWQWSIGKVTRFLDLLESEMMISRRQDSGITIVSICNYDVYNIAKTQCGTGVQKNGKKTEHKAEQIAEHLNPHQQRVSEESRNANDTEADTEAIQKRYKTNKVNKENKNTGALLDSLKSYHIALPFNSEAFLSKWKSWIEYKAKQFNFTYKTIDSEKEALNDLVKLSDNQEAISIAIINKSMVKGWKGLFKLNVEDLASNGTPKNHSTANGRLLNLQTLNHAK